MSAALQFVGLHRRFGAREVLRGVDLTVRRGSVHFVLGRSGSGKSVLIKHVVGLLRPDRGAIHVDGRDVVGLSESGFVEVRQHCQLIFQGSGLFDHLTVLDNVALPIRRRFGLRPAVARQRAREALALVQAEALAPRRVYELGEGLHKRVAIARALGLQPSLLLYDEPTTGLDPVAARRTDRLQRAMAERLAVTQVVVSHDLRSMRDVADVVSFLHDGQVIFTGTPQAFAAAPHPAIVQFMGG